MGRLFDADAESKKVEEVRSTRDGARQRAEEAEEVLKDYEETDQKSRELSESLSDLRGGVTPIHYEEYREPGGKWMIEHSPVGKDYIFQLHPIRPPKLVWQDIITMQITAMDVIFPRSLEIRYIRPDEKYQMKFYTIKVEKLVGVPGWKDAVERALAGLSAVDAWQAAKAP
jgi:hypothetical protein